ncbi:MAG TPA: DUF1800 domain-containing protein [Dokdonella sp.]|uniref:DUF1800 domain-containing protein n=1 Tax=Dokdonella sp. TaxID=2291710 RepID=UPI002D7EE091|nr:DUF1800 domain-containing protein [Dokdonella sp.]HET9031456.1 DUF1800 domain-containing protein [Dokdonella sp.]
MAAAPASIAFIASRRRLFNALFSSAGVEDIDPGLSKRRPGRNGFLPKDLPQSPAALSFPPAPVRWLTRCTFGYTYAELSAFNALGGNDNARWTAWVNRQLDPALINDSTCDARVASAGFVTLNKTPNQLWTDHHSVTNDYSLRMKPIAETESMTVIRQTYSQRQLFEVMVDFWHDHFSVFGWDYDGGPMFPAFDRLAIRPFVFGNFRTMLEEVGKSASMMYMLDLYSSEAGHPNENYARELFELHTMGAENYGGIVQDPDNPPAIDELGYFYSPVDGKKERLKYVDDDVYEAARALTGWTISGSTWPYDPINGRPLGEFAYNSTAHDQGVKRILARYFPASQGQTDGENLFDMLARHPRTARHVVTKICKRFVGSNPSSTLIDSATATFIQASDDNDQIAQVLRAILQSNEFKTSWGTGMKRPALSAVSALRGTGADFTPKPDYNSSIYTPTEEFMGRLQAAGHKLFYWPAPNGYPDDPVAWSSTGTLGMTLRMLPRLLEMHQTESYNSSHPFLIDIQGQTISALGSNLLSSTNVIGYWCDRILGYRPEPVRTVAVDFFRQNVAADALIDLSTNNWKKSNLSEHYTQTRLRTAVSLILCSPEFLRR